MKKVIIIGVMLVSLIVVAELLFEGEGVSFTEEKLEISDHSLTTYSKSNNSEYSIVFESGLGNDHTVWVQSGVLNELAKTFDILLYDRAGYGKSTKSNSSRNIENLSQDLSKVIERYAQDKKVILVGHSLGGLVVRDYAIKNPEKVFGLLFIDTSHELYNLPLSQAKEDELYGSLISEFGANFGGAEEARELRGSLTYATTLKNLPDVPTTVLTSMKNDANNMSADEFNNKSRQDWFNAHESLKTGIKEFKHIQTINSGHYIMLEEPDLVVKSIQEIVKI